MTTIPYQSPVEVDRKSDPQSLQNARRHRATLLHAIQALETSLAAPAQELGWRDRVVARLRALSAAFAEHVVVTEGTAGLYAELLDHAPRLCHGVHGLVREHAAVKTALSTLERRAVQREARIDDLRSWASDLLRELSRHRQRGADLVYEAYHTDIGGET
jgi:septation ring formation regulator EzrA